MDTEFYSRDNIQALKNLEAKGAVPITKFVSVSDGNHMTISDGYCDEGGLPYYRGTDIYNFFIEQASSPLRIEQRAFDIPNMRRSHLKKGDVLMSIVGAIIGNLSLVTTDAKATCSCKLAIMRPKDIEPSFLAIYLKSHYGQNQIQKYKRGAAQTGLILEDFDQILIPDFSSAFRLKITEIVTKTYDVLEQSQSTYSQAETLLLDALNLTTYAPTTQNTNIKSFKESFATSGRFDAEYYQPKFDEIEELIKSNGDYFKRIEEIQTYNSRGMSAIYDEAGTVDMITQKHILETGLDYENFDKTDIKHFSTDEASFVAENDILIYGTGANIGRTQPYLSVKKAVACQDIIILRVIDDPVYVAFVINSFIGRFQTDKMRTGSAQPHLYPKDVAQFIIPFVDKDTQLKIRGKIISSLALKKQSTALLEIAKRAVEIAIEQDENAGMAYIEANS
ncbi:MAG: hypothetical protein HYS23_02635 [Geobacter sp.]|nr:hypothetical protein [Geobacter sp.]